MSLGDHPREDCFYASVPLRAGDGVIIGTRCAFDTETREMSAQRVALLEDLAEQAGTQIELTQVASELGRLASYDPLTGTANRLLLADRLGRAFARQRRRGGRAPWPTRSS